MQPIQAALLFVFGSVAGCTVYTREPVVVQRVQPAVVEREVVYQPMQYEGAVVYYDSVGAPIYYVDETVYYVPRTSVHYHSLSSHYRVHARGYQTWRVKHPPHRSPRPRSPRHRR